MIMLYLRGVLLIILCGALLMIGALLIGRSMPIGETIAYLRHPEREITWSIMIRDMNRALSYDLTHQLHITGVRNRLPTWSPDGEKLAFLSELGGGLDVFVADVQARTVRPVTQTGEIINALDWSPDGERILFDLSSQTGERILYLVDVGTEEVSRLLSRESTYDILPKWSSRGDVAFISNRGENAGSVFLWDIETEEVRRLTDEISASGYLAWSPDGEQLAFSAIDLTPSTPQLIYTDIYILNLNLPNTPPYRLEVTGNERDLMWSPDGKTLAFVNDASGDDEIFTMEVESKIVKQLTDNYYPDYSPTWSPDSTRLTWVSAPDFGTSDVMLYNLTLSHVEQLTRNEIDDWFPIWQP